MAYRVPGVEGVKGVGVTVDKGSTYLGDGDSWYWVLVAAPGGEETDGEGWVFKQEAVGYYGPQEFVVDAPAEALDAYAAEQAAKRAAAQARYEESLRAEAEREARRPYRGRTVVVTGGRKIPHGTTGEVFWYGEAKFGYRSSWRVGFKTAEGEKHFTDAHNVEVVQSEAAAA